MTRNSTYRPAAGGWSLTGLLRDIGASWRLLMDPAVPGLLKLVLPVLALVYWFSPLDLLPGLPFDDIAVLLLIARLFVSLAPNESVRRAFGGHSRSRQAPPSGSDDPDSDVIDTTWHVVE